MEKRDAFFNLGSFEPRLGRHFPRFKRTPRGAIHREGHLQKFQIDQAKAESAAG